MSRPNLGKLLLPYLKTPRWAVQVSAAVLVTVAALAWAWIVGRLQGPEPIPSFEQNRMAVNPYGFGVALQWTVIPVALIYLLSSTASFRRTVVGQSMPRDKRRMLLGLLLIELLVYGYSEGLARLLREPPHLGYVVVVPLAVAVGGLLGGWRLGLILGVLGVFFRGTRIFLSFLEVLSPELIFLWQQDGLRGLLSVEWGHMLFSAYIRSPWSAPVLWTGVSAGIGAGFLGKHRYSPVIALFLGALLGLGNAGLPVLSGRSSLLEFLIPAALVSGLAMLVIALIVQGVRGDLAQRRAVAANLARTRAELRALRAQINPHFFFNALNTIRFFVRTDPETARRLLLNLSEIFQQALRAGEFIPLRDEVAYVEAYLSLEKARLGDRLQVEWSIPAEAPLEHPVPTLILQPVVENAVLHGIARNPSGGTVRITVDRTGDNLVLQVEDDGPGIDPDLLAAVLGPQRADNGTIGLRNIDGRLQAVYGEDYRLVVESEVGGGTRVRIRIPLHATAGSSSEREST